MSRPPKLDLASIVASAGPAGGARKGGARSAARANPPTGAEIVRLDLAATAPPARAGTLKERAKQMSVYLEPPVYDQLRDLAYAERTKMHALMLEALDLLFERRGARSIDQILGEPRR